jgi:hypothetical protein
LIAAALIPVESDFQRGQSPLKLIGPRDRPGENETQRSQLRLNLIVVGDNPDRNKISRRIVTIEIHATEEIITEIH